MQPIVDGLEYEYLQWVDFIRINASTPDGLKIFNEYGLYGHPSYLILDDTGKILWQSVGEQTGETLDDALMESLE
jgi:hypothetical protein